MHGNNTQKVQATARCITHNRFLVYMYTRKLQEFMKQAVHKQTQITEKKIRNTHTRKWLAAWFDILEYM